MNCEFCERNQPLTEHHLIPRSVHSKSWFKNRYAKKDMKGRKIMLCQLCHSAIHDFWSEVELGKNYNTKELLIAQQAVKNFIVWARKQK